MALKGIIKSVNYNDNTCIVRIPVWEPIGSEETAILATFSIAPGTYNGYKPNDVVWVDLENYEPSKPVVIGKLYLGAEKEQASPRGVVNCESLNVTQNARLPITTKIVSSSDSGIVDERNDFGYHTVGEVITAISQTAKNLKDIDVRFSELITGATTTYYIYSVSRTELKDAKGNQLENVGLISSIEDYKPGDTDELTNWISESVLLDANDGEFPSHPGLFRWYKTITVYPQYKDHAQRIVTVGPYCVQGTDGENESYFLQYILSSSNETIEGEDAWSKEAKTPTKARPYVWARLVDIAYYNAETNIPADACLDPYLFDTLDNLVSILTSNGVDIVSKVNDSYVLKADELYGVMSDQVKIAGFTIGEKSLHAGGIRFIDGISYADITTVYRTAEDAEGVYTAWDSGDQLNSESKFYNPLDTVPEELDFNADITAAVEGKPFIVLTYTGQQYQNTIGNLLCYTSTVDEDFDGETKTYDLWSVWNYNWDSTTETGTWHLDAGAAVYTNQIVIDVDNSLVYLGTDKIELTQGSKLFQVEDGKVFANAGSIGGWEIGDLTLRSVSSNVDKTLTLCSIPDATPINFPEITNTRGNWQDIASPESVAGEFPPVDERVTVYIHTVGGSYIYSATASNTIELLGAPESCIAYYNGTSIELGSTPKTILEEAGALSTVRRLAQLSGTTLTLTTTAQISTMNELEDGARVIASALKLGSETINIEVTYPRWAIQVDETVTVENLGFDDTDILYIKNNDDVIELTENEVTVDSGNDNVTLSITRVGTELNLRTSYKGATKINYTSPTYSIASTTTAYETAVLWVGNSDSTKAPFKILGDGTIQAFKGAIRFNSAGTAASIIPGWSTGDTNDCCLNYNSCEFNSAHTTTTLLGEYISKFKGQLGTDVNNYATSDGTVSKIDGLSVASSFTSSILDTPTPLYCNYSQVTSNGITLGSRVPGIGGNGDYNYCTLEFASGDAILNKAKATITANNSDLVIEAKDKTGRLAGTWTTDAAISVDSDQNLKHSIEPLTENYSVLFDNLRPVRFKYNNGTSDRYHTGFIAQEVDKAITNAGLTTADVGAYVKAKDIELEDGTVKAGTSGIRYEELIALCVEEIQSLKTKVSTLEAELEKFKS